MTTTNIVRPAADPFAWPPPGVCGWLDGTCEESPGDDDWLCPTHRGTVMWKPAHQQAAHIAATVAALLES